MLSISSIARLPARSARALASEKAGRQDAALVVRADHGGKLLCRVILADRHRADPRDLHESKTGLPGPGVELRLHLGEVALRGGGLGDIEAGIAQAQHDVSGCYKTVPAEEAQYHLAGIAAEPAAALREKFEQAGLVGGRPFRQELAEAAMLAGNIPDEAGIGAHRHDLG